MITATSVGHSLCSPMFDFLEGLSFVDLCYVSVTVPRSIYNSFCRAMTFPSGNARCSALLSLSVALPSSPCSQRCPTIAMWHLPSTALWKHHGCLPMRPWKHGCVGSGAISGAMHTAGTFSTHFSGSRAIHQFYCDLPSSWKSLVPMSVSVQLQSVPSCLWRAFLCIPFVGLSCTQIFSAVQKLPSAKGRGKVFSTCLPHLAVLTFFLSAGVFEVLQPTSDSAVHCSLFSLLYTHGVPNTQTNDVQPEQSSHRGSSQRGFQRRRADLFCRWGISVHSGLAEYFQLYWENFWLQQIETSPH